MRCFALAGLVLALVTSAAPMQAQELMVASSCAVADSLYGPLPAKPKKLKAKYDKMEDVSTYTLVTDASNALFKDGEVSIVWEATHPGKSFATPTIAVVSEFEVTGADKDNTFKNADLTEKSKLAQMQRLPVLVDDSIRFSLEATSSKQRQGSNIFVGRKMTERAIYQLTPEQAQIFAVAHTVRIRIDDRMMKLETKDFGNLRELLRYQTCRAPAAPAMAAPVTTPATPTETAPVVPATPAPGVD
jgi:hypothetical protein